MENFMLPEAKALMDDGWESIVITNFKDELVKALPEGMRHYSLPLERTYNLKVAGKCIWSLYKIFRKEKPDLVQYGTTHACLFGSIAAFMARAPKRIFLQWGPTGYLDQKGPMRAFTKGVEQTIGKLNTHIRTVSRLNMRDSINDHLYSDKKVKVVGEGGTIGVDLAKFDIGKKEAIRREIREKLGVSNDTFLFGFVGRICKPKGFNELIAAFREVSRGRDCKLVVIGPKESGVDEGLMRWAEESDKVILIGRVAHDLIWKYFCALDVLVHPTYREGFGMVLQEAMALEIPIITTDIPGPSEVIEDGKSGRLVKAQDVETLRDAMQDAVDNPSDWKKLGKAGRERVKKHFERSVRLALLVNDKNQIYSGQ